MDSPALQKPLAPPQGRKRWDTKDSVDGIWERALVRLLSEVTVRRQYVVVDGKQSITILRVDALQEQPCVHYAAYQATCPPRACCQAGVAKWLVSRHDLGEKVELMPPGWVPSQEGSGRWRAIPRGVCGSRRRSRGIEEFLKLISRNPDALHFGWSGWCATPRLTRVARFGIEIAGRSILGAGIACS